jgi:hypothetical protein
VDQLNTLCEALHAAMTSEPKPGHLCSAVLTAVEAQLMDEPVSEVTEVTETHCWACDVVSWAFLSTLTLDAWMELAYRRIEGDALATLLLSLLPVQSSGVIQ